MTSASTRKIPFCFASVISQPSRHIRLDDFRSFQNFGRFSLLNDFALVHDNHLVGNLPDGGNVMLDENNQLALASQFRQQAEDFLNHFWMNAGYRLIQQQNLRLRGEAQASVKSFCWP